MCTNTPIAAAPRLAVGIPFGTPRRALALLAPALLALTSCATVGSMMSPYSEKFSCKNSDHGQCIHPDAAYQDAVAGRASRSDPAVTRDRKLLRTERSQAAGVGVARSRNGNAATGDPFSTYRDSVYRELQGLIERPITPMLKPPRTIRTLILPYADRQRPDRLYMPRYIYSVIDEPVWVVGDYLVEPVSAAARAPVLGQVREPPTDATSRASAPARPGPEPRP